MLQAYSEESAQKNGDDLEEALLSLYPTDIESTDALSVINEHLQKLNRGLQALKQPLKSDH